MSTKPSSLRRAAALGLAIVAALLPPNAAALILARQAPQAHSDASAELSLALGASSWGSVEESDFHTQSELFDREWNFGTPMMRLACLAQVGLRHPEAAEELAPFIEASAAQLGSPAARAFSRSRWGSDPLAEGSVDDHTAFLGYAGFALGLGRAALPRSGALEQDHDAVILRLRRTLRGARGRWPRTYPGEAYPVDVASAVGALAIADRLQGTDPAADPDLSDALDRLRGASDPTTGLLVQSVDPDSGAVRDGPRGSGTFLATYFVLPADPRLARGWFDAGVRELSGNVLGFGVMRERPVSASGGGDIDSGPVIFGYGVSASGFALAPARAFGNDALYRRLYATASLFGVPIQKGRGVTHVAGGPLGDAILCATATAPTSQELAAWLDARARVAR